jgi:hypothetical protein
MHAVNLSKPFSVDVYSDRKPLNESTWLRIREFEEIDDVIDARKKVVDDFLRSPLNAFVGSEQLVTAFLRHGDAPAIIGAENLNNFNVYEYLNRRCGEIGRLTKSSSLNP